MHYGYAPASENLAGLSRLSPIISLLQFNHGNLSQEVVEAHALQLAEPRAFGHDNNLN